MMKESQYPLAPVSDAKKTNDLNGACQLEEEVTQSITQKTVITREMRKRMSCFQL
jgi:hypothetical protein